MSGNQNPFATQWRQFAAETKDHGLSVLHSDGLYRHLRMKRPGTGIWHWDVITWPGRLCIVGDIGDGLVFSREDDMIDFFRTSLRSGRYSDGAPQISISYWAEKLSRGAKDVKSYSDARFLGIVRNALDESGATEAERAEFIAGAESVSMYEHDAREWLQEERRAFGDGTWEWDLTDWDHHFILSCYAIAATVKAVSA